MKRPSEKDHLGFRAYISDLEGYANYLEGFGPDGNWMVLIDKYESLIGRKYIYKGEVYCFFGLVWGRDDLYYGMRRESDGKSQLLSCVSDPEGFDFFLDGTDTRRKNSFTDEYEHD